MINSRKLKALVVENGYNQKDVAQLLGVSVNSFNRKLNNKTQFTLSEAYLLKNILRVDDMEKVFFINNIPKTQQNEQIS